ncbi:phosphotriesterase-related protein [Lewinella marina]|uniref:Aryldialkylphosphatase n=1 Tax=Neolewinella marina TaxID=438751 RepID=A0A2G0CCF1_9BACT|nr:aryldialkylphosphatase [Neolewinella marina]NJB87676.1 phosphotriesterase-related protein [Neolewinella marina]PHK97641.1 aryldialkylphosphatase [Neolewinella marina]
MLLPVPRRAFLQSLATLLAGSCLALPAAGRRPPAEVIMTVGGPISPDALGFCLPHEHVLSRFGAPPVEPAPYETAAAAREVVPYLKYLAELGVGAIADCTAYSFGRAPELLRELSRLSGLHLITNTGYYGAADDRYVPAEAYDLDAQGIADRWIAEFTDGIGETGIRPGFIKTAVDSGPLSPIDGRLVRAAAITHRATGLSMAIHTGDNAAAAEQQLQILAEEGVSPRAWAWTHAQNLTDPAPLLEAAGRGAWISLDGIKTPYFQAGRKQGDDTLDRHLQHLLALRAGGLLDRVLLSHDGSSFPPDLAARRPMDTLANTFLPLLRAAGFTEAEIHQLTVTNPAGFFTIRQRLR